MLLMCVSFAEMSAQDQNLRWEISSDILLEIRVNGALVVNENSSGNGEVLVPEGATVDVFVVSNFYYLQPIISEDDPYMIELAAYADYNFTNEDQISLRESFVMPPYGMYVWMRS